MVSSAGLRAVGAIALLAACTVDPGVADDFGFGDGTTGAGADEDTPVVDDGDDDDGSVDDGGDETGDAGDDAMLPEPPHAHGTIVLGEVHPAGGTGQSTPIVAATFIPDSEAVPRACGSEIDGCFVSTVPVCADGCGLDQYCSYDAACLPTCMTLCTLACNAGEECYFPVPGSPACKKSETFDAGALSFAGTTVPVTLFPPYEFVGDVTGALALPGHEIMVHASGATTAGFAAFERDFVTTDLLVSFIDQITMDQAYGAGPLPVRWQAGTDELRITVTVAGVGGSYGTVTCDAPDSGSYDLSRKAILASVPGDVPSSIHLDLQRRAVTLHKDVATTGALLGATVRSEAWLELVSSSSESTSIAGCGGLAYCAGQCVDTQSDESNCGACNAVCAAGEVCSLGECVSGGGNAGTCCSVSASPGCSNAAVQACVCANDSFCCSSSWDSACVSGVQTYGCGVCP